MRQRAPSIQARARVWSPSPTAGDPAGAAAATAAGDKAAQDLIPAQKENLNPQASPAHSSIASFPGEQLVASWCGGLSSLPSASTACGSLGFHLQGPLIIMYVAGPTASGTFVVERPPEPETDDDAAQGGMGSFVSGGQRRVRSASGSSHMSAESSGSR